MNYPINTQIQYSDDFEYRAAIRQLFAMSSAASLLENTIDIDPISLDENKYDADATTEMLDFVYAATKCQSRFVQIYKHAAGFMFSEDPEIGLAVLFSYDYLVVFHPVLCEFFMNASVSVDDSTPAFKALAKKLALE